MNTFGTFYVDFQNRYLAQLHRNTHAPPGHRPLQGFNAGQLVYVAEVGDPIKTSIGKNDARLRVIYANGTESNLLRRSYESIRDVRR